jgi:CubicO group peptidase (beta-lactamase class C family)
VTGEQFFDYVEKHIFAPCGMKCCYPEQSDPYEIAKNKAEGYRCVKSGKFEKSIVYRSKWLYPSGSAIGTTEDLAKFAEALMPKNGEKSPLFKNSDALAKMFETSHYSKNGDDLFSLHHGFWGTNGNFRGLSQYGDVDGFVANFAIIPDERRAAIILVNTEAGFDMSYGLTPLIIGNYFDDDGTENLPDASVVTGNYLCTLDRFHDRTVPPEPYRAVKTGENLIKITHGNGMMIFKQIKPYVYSNISSTRGEEHMSKIYFKPGKDGKIVKASMFHRDFMKID